MIRQIGLRIGGSSLYYFTADQLEIATFEECEDHTKKDAYWAISGSEILNVAGFASESARTASIYIKLPFNTISALQKALPLPTDLLTQPIQLLIETNRAQDVFFPLAGANVANLPTGFASAQVQFKAIHMQDSSKLLARREDMNVKALMHPLRSFEQTTFRTTVQAVAGQEVQINLTGFKSGSVKAIKMWALKVADGMGAPTNVPGNNRNYSQILDCRLSVNGMVYYDTRSASSNLWNLCDLKTPGYVEQTVLTDGGAGSAIATPSVASWVHIPLAQVVQSEANETEVALGLPISNSVVNVSVKLPEDGRYVLSASYEYACSLMFSKGSAEYVF
jgi:hypothetical protein